MAKNMNTENWGRAKAKERGYAKGGRVKGNTTVNIVIPQKDSPPPMPPMPPPGPMLPPPGALLPPGAGPGGPPPGLGAPPGMKSGGKVPVSAGSESGEGRLQKKRIYGKKAR